MPDIIRFYCGSKICASAVKCAVKTLWAIGGAILASWLLCLSLGWWSGWWLEAFGAWCRTVVIVLAVPAVIEVVALLRRRQSRPAD